MNSAATYEIQKVFLNDILLSGLNAASFSYSVSRSPVNILGYSTKHIVVNDAWTYGLELNKNLLNEDVLATMTGIDSITGTFIFNSDGKGIATSGSVGVIESYSVQAQAGAVPTVSANLAFYESGSSFWIDQDEPTLPIGDYDMQIIPQSGIRVSAGTRTSDNIVTDFTYNVKFNWQVFPQIKKTAADSRFFVVLARPVEYDATMTIIVDDYMAERIAFNNAETVVINFYNITGGLVNTFSVPNCQLQSESIAVGVDNIPTATISFKGVS